MMEGNPLGEGLFLKEFDWVVCFLFAKIGFSSLFVFLLIILINYFNISLSSLQSVHNILISLCSHIISYK